MRMGLRAVVAGANGNSPSFSLFPHLLTVESLENKGENGRFLIRVAEERQPGYPPDGSACVTRRALSIGIKWRPAHARHVIDGAASATASLCCRAGFKPVRRGFIPCLYSQM
jgi:hypothetical protein